MQIPELRILTPSDKTIFDTNEKYIIPLYQRDYAWTEKAYRYNQENVP